MTGRETARRLISQAIRERDGIPARHEQATNKPERQRRSAESSRVISEAVALLDSLPRNVYHDMRRGGDFEMARQVVREFGVTK